MMARIRWHLQTARRPHAAGLLNEVFLTETISVVDEARRVVKIFDFAAEGATLIAEGRLAERGAWRYRRWRFSSR